MIIFSMSLFGLACSGFTKEPSSSTTSDIVAPQPSPQAPPAQSATSVRYQPPSAPTGTQPRLMSTYQEPPILLFAFSHHYNGKGGYYPTAAEVRGIGEACDEVGLTNKCTLFLDGVLVDQLQQSDPSLRQWFRSNPFPIGYHGDDTHGPNPLVEDLAEMLGQPNSTRLVPQGADFDSAISSVRNRYTKHLSGYEIKPDRYLNRSQRSTVQSSQPGGIELVQDYTGRSVEIITGLALFQPLVSLALEGMSDYYVHQESGPFASHFSQKSCDPRELTQQIGDFMGTDTQVFWFMGRLAVKGRRNSTLPQIDEDSARGGHPSGGGSDRPPKGKKPPRGKKSGGPPSDRSAHGTGGNSSSFEAAVHKMPRSRTAPTLYNFKMSGDPDRVADGLRLLQSREDVVFVTAADVWLLVEGPQVTLSPTQTATALKAAWSGGPPDSLDVQGSPASLTDAFQVLAEGLTSGSTAATVSPVLGPMGKPSTLSQASGTVSATEVKAAAASTLAAVQRDRALPMNISVGSKSVGFHQYLYLMAEATLSPNAAKISIPSATHAPPFASWLVSVMGRPDKDIDFWTTCQYWTARPARWR